VSNSTRSHDSSSRESVARQRNHFRLYAAILLLLCSTALFGQTGRPAFIPMDDDKFDSVNLENLNVLVHAPVFSKAGAMPVSIMWSANSYCTGTSATWQCGAEAPTVTNFGAIVANSFLGGPTNVGWATAYPLQSAVEGCLRAGYSHYAYWQWVVREANGTLHPLPPADILVTGGDPTYCLSKGFTDTTIDGSGYTVTVGPGYTVSPIISAGGVTIDSVFPSATSITDPNNNKVSIGTTQYNDTLGLVAATASPNVNTPTSVSWTDVESGSPKVSVTTSPVKFETNFGCSGISEVPPGSSAPQFSGLSFPDGSSLSITYEPTSGKSGYVTGRIQTLTLPTGGTVTYSYTGALDCTNGSFDYLTRTTSDGTTTYSVTPAGSSYGAVTTVTDQGGNVTIYTFSVPSSNGTVVLSQVQQYKGAQSPSNLLKTTLYCYNNNTSNCAQATVEFPINQGTVYTTPAGGSARASAYTYDKYGNTLTDSEYDFGASNPTITTTTVYGSWDTSTSKCVAVSTTVNNRPCTVVTVSGTNTLAQARLSYDAYGNLTTKSTWTGSTWLTTTATYNGNGTVATSHDAANNLTSYFYNGTGGCNGVFPTSVSSGGLTTSNTWDCTGGVLLTHTDANSKPTTYGYENSSDAADPFWRVSSVTDPLSNETWVTYTPNSVETSLTFGSSTNDLTNIVDGYGRPIRSQILQAPGSTSYDTTSAKYGWSGNYRSVATTMPCTVGLGADCSFSSGVTTGLFDPLGRQYTTTDGGQGTVTSTYPLNDVLNVVGPPPTGEHTKNHQLEYDGLGRLTSVCEILNSGGTSCGQKTSASGYKTSYAYSVPAAGVSQIVVTQGSQTRTYQWDGLGRLTYENNPESGVTNYFWDAAPPICYDNKGYPTPGNLGGKKDANDLIPCFRTKLSMISAKGRGRRYVEEQAHGSADDRGVEAGGGRAKSRRCGARGGGVEAHALRLEGEVRWDGCEPGTGSEAAAR
jgi:YD repeat-containing protein